MKNKNKYNLKFFYYIFFNFWLFKILAKFMFNGKLNLSESLLYKVIYLLNHFSVSIMLIFESLDLIKPAIELIIKRLGRRFYSVPTPLNYRRQIKKSIFLFFKAVCSSSFKHNNPIFFFFIFELQNIIFSFQSNSISECVRLHNKGIYGRTYTHWRWK